MKTGKFLILLINTTIMLGWMSCSTIPKGVKAVEPFEKGTYLGKWYEIARMDFKFERGLNNTTAEYSLNTDGSIRVINKGYNVEKAAWKQAIGKAKFVGNETVAMLKVSFFGPFYGGYNVIALDSAYNYALIAGANFKYLWILSRKPVIPDDVRKDYLKIAEDYGFKTSELLWIEHDQQK